ncbi:MAG: prenyltransferase/squalene oxidase repeat-containing protein [Planctomycetota bacterium]|jgi:hypothetical protein
MEETATSPAPASASAELAGRVLDLLAGHQRADGGWPYLPAQQNSFTEATCWALLALHAGGRLTDSAAASAAGFLRGVQDTHGGLHAGTLNEEANWCTALAVFALGVVRPEEPVLRWGLDWLLEFEGYHWPRRRKEVVAHDTALRGWPWVTGCHSWDEPTCYAIYALKTAGLGEHPRVREAVRMIRDRSLPSGGWNYGNTRVLGQELRAFPSTTGMALIALLGLPEGPQTRSGLEYLGQAFPRLQTPWALGWSILAGRLWGVETF